MLLAVIGPRWLTIADAAGRRRLDNPDDFVRLEISTALKRKIRVIPLLVEGAAMPYSTDLPDDLKLLARRNALTIGVHFHPDVDRLIEVLEKVLNAPPPAKPKQPSPKPKRTAAKPKLTPKPASLPDTLTLSKPFQMEFTHIPAGEFLMGSDPAKDKDGDGYEQPPPQSDLARLLHSKIPGDQRRICRLCEDDWTQS